MTLFDFPIKLRFYLRQIARHKRVGRSFRREYAEIKSKNWPALCSSLQAESRGAVPPSPLVLSELLMKGVRKVISLAPPPQDRLTGKLARDGGKRVRDRNLRPYSGSPSHSVSEWFFKVGPVLGKLFRTGAEGAPQKLSKEFAKKWAEYCGVEHGLLLPHGTDALKVALAAALEHDGMDYGGEVIVPNLGFIASVNSALDRRIGVALVDVDPVTLNIDPRKVEEAIIPGKTRAIMPVHLFGQPADMKALREIAKRHSLVIIEDAAQAHGAIHEFGRAGALGDAAAFSFQSSKNLSAGEGGAMTTNNEAIFARADCIHNVGRAHTGAHRWSHETLGWNLRPSEYTAAVLLHRMQTLEAEQETRHARFNLLRESLADVTCVEPLGIGPGVVRHAAYMFVLRYKPENCGGLVIDDFINAVCAEGAPLFRAYEETLSQQPALQTVAEKHPEYIRVLPTPVADQAVKEIMCIPPPRLPRPGERHDRNCRGAPESAGALCAATHRGRIKKIRPAGSRGIFPGGTGGIDTRGEAASLWDHRVRRDGARTRLGAHKVKRREARRCLRPATLRKSGGGGI